MCFVGAATEDEFTIFSSSLFQMKLVKPSKKHQEVIIGCQSS